MTSGIEPTTFWLVAYVSMNYAAMPLYNCFMEAHMEG
jgi:cytochrome c oxidase assembly protein Cox11